MGFEPIQVFAGGAPIKVRSEGFLGFLRSALSGNLSQALQVLNVLLVGLAYSNTREDVPNYGSGQYVVSQDVLDDAVTIFSDTSFPSAFLDPNGYSAAMAATAPMLAYKFSTDPLSLFNDVMINFFSTAIIENDDDPCVNKYEEGVGIYDKLCDALDENDLTKVVEEADYMIDLCHSLTDELASFKNVPDTFNPTYVTVFNITGFSHGGSNLPCGARIISKLAENPLRNPKLKKTKKPKKPKKTKKPKKNKL